MNNIHVIPTDKPSRLHTYRGVLNFTVVEFVAPTIVQKNVLINLNIYITSDEEIKEGDWVIKISSIYKGGGFAQKYSFIDAQFEDIIFKKIILTTDASLDGVQVIDDNFLEWFVKNPSCEFVKIVDDVECLPMPNIHINKHIYKIIIPKEEPKQENCCTPANQIKRYVDCVGCDRKPKQMSKQTAVEYLIEVCANAGIKVSKQLQEEVLQMEKEQSQNYAIFAIRCDRTEMRILEFNDYIKLEEKEEK